MRSSLLIAAIAQTLLLCGCIVSRVDPEKPELPLPAALPNDAQQTVQLPTPWWTMFGDATLDRLIDEALTNNPDVNVAAARVAEARSSLRIVNADRFPSVDLEGNVVRSRESTTVNQMPGLEQPRTVYTVQGVVGYELDL